MLPFEQKFLRAQKIPPVGILLNPEATNDGATPIIHPLVRRHGFLDRPQLELSEYLAHLFVDVKRPACGIASAVR